ncbi:BTB-domain-containing protein [Gigaspora margarita]|uniref:BTB-domain-containing protein n=1 Tax=Gigaspora margarita TaxID=4874 RepID=A0A8H4AUW6_GIGMA|nr:BTB-domain-containing protein [Gigaspora margarita]
MSTGLLKKLSQDYKNLVESSEFADISIQVGDESNKAYFYAHSLILRTRSSYFREVLSKLGDKLESEKVILFDKPNITPKLFEILFRYIYDELVKKHISLINRKGLSNFKKLDALWKQFVIEDTDIFNSNDFTTLQKEEFLHFYINRPNNVTEIELWEKLLKWATIQSGSLPSDVSQYADNHFATLKKIIKPFIQYINFKSIRKDDFYQNVHPFNKAFDPKIYIKILEIYTFNINQESSITNKPFDNLSISPSSLNISSILPNQSSKKSAILTTDVKLPISLEINFGTSTIKSTTITASKPNTVTDIKPTDSTFASTSITSTFIPMRQLTIQSNIIEQNHIVLIVKWINEINNSIVSKVIDTKHAIRQNRYTGPSFGKNDLKICGELKENEKSRCRKSSYEKPIRNNTEFFSVDDYEVFQVFRKSTLQN